MKIRLTVLALAVIVALFLGVRAQNVSQCLVNCLEQAAAANDCNLYVSYISNYLPDTLPGSCYCAPIAGTPVDCAEFAR